MNLSPPPPPPPQAPPSSLFHLPIHTSSGNSFPVIAIALIGILATAFLLIGYYVFVIKCCLNWHRLDVLSRFSSRRPHSPNDAVSSSEDATKGLDEAVIRSIPVIKFRKLPDQERGADPTSRRNINQTILTSANTNTNTNTYECAVCLSEFEDDERLRVIPNCCHAFHIDCIDVWLQSNANCPLCRSTISPSSVLYNNVDRILLNPPPPPRPLSPPAHCTAGGDNADDDSDYVVIEIQGNNLDRPRFVPQERKHGKKKLEHVCSMGDEWIDIRKKDEEFKDVVQPIRRSISMDLSVDREFCLEIQQCSSKLVSQTSSEDCSSNSSGGSKVRRSIFSFGHGRRSSRGSNSIQPLHLDP